MQIKRSVMFGMAMVNLLGLLLTAILYFFIRASLPARKGIVAAEGLSSSVRITFDEKGIPQVWADNEKDAWFAVGWLHASGRLFKMEMAVSQLILQPLT